MKRLLPLMFILALAAVAYGSQASTTPPEVLPLATAEPVLGVAATPNPAPVASGEALIRSQFPQGGTLLRLWVDPPTLDPHLTGDVNSAVIIVEVFGGLVTFEPQDPTNIKDQQLEIVGDLAESWEISGGGRTYTFHLRKNAKIHNGKAVTAHDVKWSWNGPRTPPRKRPRWISSWETF